MTEEIKENDNNNRKASKKKKRRIVLGIIIAIIAVLFIIDYILNLDTGENDKPDPPVDNGQTVQINIGEVNIINVGDITVEISSATESDEEKLEKTKTDEILSTGKTKEGNNFVGRGDEVIVSTGDTKVKGVVKKSDKKIDSGKVAAVVSAALKTANNEPKEEDFSLKQSIYFAEIADCNFYYPAQMQLVEKNSEWLHFLDSKSEAELFVRFTSLDEIAASAVSLEIIEPSKYAARNDYNRVCSAAEGNGYMVNTTLLYPDKYSYAYDVLKNLIKIEFMEQNCFSYEDTLYYGPNTEMKTIFFPYYSCGVIIPLEFEETGSDGDTLYYKDYIKDHTLTLSFSELPYDTNIDNIFEIFDVVAEDNAVMLSENCVTWHNGSGIHIGAYNSNIAALIEVDGADSWDSYYDSLDLWDINFVDNSMFRSFADMLREEIYSEISSLWDVIDELMMGDPGDMSDPGDDFWANTNPLSEQVKGELRLSNYEKILYDEGSIYSRLGFSNMLYPHDCWDGDLAQICYYPAVDENGDGYYLDNGGPEVAKFREDVSRLMADGFDVVYTGYDYAADEVICLTDYSGTGVWVSYGDGGAQLLFFETDTAPTKGREMRKIYFSENLKREFANDILPDIDAMDDFANDINNFYNSMSYYYVDEFVYESVLYFYEMDRRQDGGLQCDVFRCDENLTYIETLAFVNYDLYRVLDDGQMVFIR